MHTPRSIRTLAVAVAALSVVIGFAPASRGGIRSRVRGAAPRFGGLNVPAAFTFAPNGRIWYGEKDTGEIRMINPNTGKDHLFRKVAGVNGAGERGLLGIALHPDFPDVPYVYVYVTRSVDGRLKNQVLRFTDRDGHGRDLKVIVSSRASNSPYHNGGRILFGPDRRLYAIVGEGHDPSHSQDVDDERGKILRMKPNGHAPDDNPFRGSIVFAYGIRNSFGFAFDPETGSLWESDNGPECNDELNLILSGENYGWGPHETCGGQAPENTNQDGPSPELPKLFYANTIGITGLAFCDGCGLGAQSEGAFFHGDVNTGNLTRIDLNGARDDITDHTVVFSNGQGMLSLEVAPDGAIWFSDFNSIQRLVLS